MRTTAARAPAVAVATTMTTPAPHTRTAAQAGADGTDDTSANGHSTRGTTNDNDTSTRLGTDDTSRNGADPAAPPTTTTPTPAPGPNTRHRRTGRPDGPALQLEARTVSAAEAQHHCFGLDLGPT